MLSYLIAALDRSPLGIVDIGGDRLTFKQMMQEYADARHLYRIIIPVPVPVRLSLIGANWVGLVTPIPLSLIHIQMCIRDRANAVGHGQRAVLVER